MVKLLRIIHKYIKTKMKKIKNFILFILFISFFCINSTKAIDYNVDFNSSWSYTLSNTWEVYVNNWMWHLKEDFVYNGKITNATTLNWAYDVVVEWNLAYMTSNLNSSVLIFDISNKSTPVLTWSIVNNWWTIRLGWAAWIVKS